MAELTLPQNSKVQKGKEYPLEDDCENKKGFSIYRWSPDDDENPRTDYYEIDKSKCGPKEVSYTHLTLPTTSQA